MFAVLLPRVVRVVRFIGVIRVIRVIKVIRVIRLEVRVTCGYYGYLQGRSALVTRVIRVIKSLG